MMRIGLIMDVIQFPRIFYKDKQIPLSVSFNLLMNLVSLTIWI